MTAQTAMTNAWYIKRYTGYNFSKCLSMAWHNQSAIDYVNRVCITILLITLLFILKSSYKNNSLDMIRMNNRINTIQLRIKNEFIDNVSNNILANKDLQGIDKRYYAEYIYNESVNNNLDPYLILAFGFTETNFNYKMVGMAGERGYLQFMVSTAKWLIGTDNYKHGIEKDIMVSTKLWFKYINYLRGRVDCSNFENVMLAYNIGESRYNKLLGYYGGNIDKVKWYVYKRRGWSVYSDKINFFLDKLKNMA